MKTLLYCDKINENYYKIMGDFIIFETGICHDFEGTIEVKNDSLYFNTKAIVLDRTDWGIFYGSAKNPWPKEEEEGGIDENGIIDDTISPLGVNQAVSLEIRRIHKKGIENVMRKIGNSWKEKPIYHFVAVIDDAEWIGENIDKWDTGYIGWETFRFVEDEQEECIIELKIFETKKICMEMAH